MCRGDLKKLRFPPPTSFSIIRKGRKPCGIRKSRATTAQSSAETRPGPHPPRAAEIATAAKKVM
jgi:hypothetical protein